MRIAEKIVETFKKRAFMVTYFSSYEWHMQTCAFSNYLRYIRKRACFLVMIYIDQ